MSKRKDVFNSPEYRHIEEHLDEILNELEGDEETRDMTMPEAWDQDFREVLERVKKEKKQRHRRRFCRTLAAAAAAVIVLVPVIGFVGPETVEGDGIMELFEKNVFMNGRRYGMAGTNELHVGVDSENLNETIFSGSDIRKLNDELKLQVKHPFYRLNWIPEGFEVREAVYNQEFDSINVEMYNGNNYIYFSQQFIMSEETKSNVTQNNELATVINKELGVSISIYDSIADTGFSFSIIANHAKLDCYMETTLEECKTLAQGITYE